MKKSKHIIILLSFIMLWETNPIQAQIGVLTAGDDLSLTSTASYEAEIKDLTGPGTGHDQIVVSNDLTLDGTLDILLSGYSPDTNDSFEIMSYGGTLSGVFSIINWPADMLSQGWLIDYGVLIPGFVTIYGPSNALPVELLSFTVTQKDLLHLLTWKTATEINNDFFAVEHSTNGKDFSVIGKVEGQGDYVGIQEYTFTNQDSRNGNHYYRLRQVDFDGQFDYSEIVSVSNRLEQDITFYPNPTAESITFNEAVTGLIIYNLQGSIVLSASNPGTNIDLSNLSPGTYFVRTNESTNAIERLIINK